MYKKLFIIQLFLLFFGFTPIYTGADNKISSQKKKSSRKHKRIHSKRKKDTGEFSTTVKTATGCASAIVVGFILRSIQSSNVPNESEKPTEKPTNEFVPKKTSNKPRPSTSTSQNNSLNLVTPVTISNKNNVKKKPSKPISSHITSVGQQKENNKLIKNLISRDISPIKEEKPYESSSSDEYEEKEHGIELNTNYPSQPEFSHQHTQHLDVPKIYTSLLPHRSESQVEDYVQVSRYQNDQITQNSQRTPQIYSDSSDTDKQNEDGHLRPFASNNEVYRSNLESANRDHQRFQQKNRKHVSFRENKYENDDESSASSNGTFKIISPILESPIPSHSDHDQDSNESDIYTNHTQAAIVSPTIINQHSLPSNIPLSKTQKEPSNHITPPLSSQKEIITPFSYNEIENDNFSINKDNDEFIQPFILPPNHNAKFPTKTVHNGSSPKAPLLPKDNIINHNIHAHNNITRAISATTKNEQIVLNKDINSPIPFSSQEKYEDNDAHSISYISNMFYGQKTEDSPTFSTQFEPNEEEEEKQILLFTQPSNSNNNHTTLPKKLPLLKLNAITPIKESNENNQTPISPNKTLENNYLASSPQLSPSIEISEKDNPTSDDNDEEYSSHSNALSQSEVENQNDDNIYTKTKTHSSALLATPSTATNTIIHTTGLDDDLFSSSDDDIIDTREHKKRAVEGIPSLATASPVLHENYHMNDNDHDIGDIIEAVNETKRKNFHSDSSQSSSEDEDDHQNDHINQSNSQNKTLINEGGNSPISTMTLPETYDMIDNHIAGSLHKTLHESDDSDSSQSSSEDEDDHKNDHINQSNSQNKIPINEGGNSPISTMALPETFDTIDNEIVEPSEDDHQNDDTNQLNSQNNTSIDNQGNSPISTMALPETYDMIDNHIAGSLHKTLHESDDSDSSQSSSDDEDDHKNDHINQSNSQNKILINEGGKSPMSNMALPETFDTIDNEIVESSEDNYQNDDTNQLNSQSNTSINEGGKSPISTMALPETFDTIDNEIVEPSEDDYQNDDTNQLDSQNNTPIDNGGKSPTSTALSHTSDNDQIVNALSETPHQNDNSNSPQPSSDDEDDHQNDDTNQLNSQNNTPINEGGNSPISIMALPETFDTIDNEIVEPSEDDHQNDDTNQLNSQNNTSIDNGGKSPTSTALPHTSDNDQIVHTLSETPHQNDNSNSPQPSSDDEDDHQNDDTNQLNSQNNTPINEGGNSPISTMALPETFDTIDNEIVEPSEDDHQNDDTNQLDSQNNTSIDNGGNSPTSTALSHTSDNDQIVHTLSETPHQNDNSNSSQSSSDDEDDYQNDDTNQLDSQNNTPIDNGGKSPTSTALPHTSGNDQIVHALSETSHQNDSNAPQLSSGDEEDYQNDDTNQLNSQNNTSIDNGGSSPTSTALPHTSDNDQIVHALSETPHQNDNSNSPQPSSDDEDDHQNDDTNQLNSQNNTPIDNGGKSPTSTALPHTSGNDQIVHALSETSHQNDSNAPQLSSGDEDDHQNDDTNQLNSQNNTPINEGGNSPISTMALPETFDTIDNEIVEPSEDDHQNDDTNQLNSQNNTSIDNGGSSPTSTALPHTSDNDQIVHALSETPHQNDNSNSPQPSSDDEDDHQNDDTNQLNSQNNTPIDNGGKSPTSTALPHTSGNDQIVHALSETSHQNDSNAPQLSSGDEDDHQNDDTNQLNSQNNTPINEGGNSPISTMALPETFDTIDNEIVEPSEDDHQNDDTNQLNSQNNTSIDNQGNSPTSTALSHTSDNDQIVHTLSETPHQNDNSNAPQLSSGDEEDYQNDDTNQLNSQNNTPINEGGKSPISTMALPETFDTIDNEIVEPSEDDHQNDDTNQLDSQNNTSIDNQGNSPTSTALPHTSGNDQIVHTLSETPHQNDSNSPQPSSDDEDDHQNDDTNQLNSQNNTPINEGGKSPISTMALPETFDTIDNEIVEPSEDDHQNDDTNQLDSQNNTSIDNQGNSPTSTALPHTSGNDQIVHTLSETPHQNDSNSPQPSSDDEDDHQNDDTNQLNSQNNTPINEGGKSPISTMALPHTSDNDQIVHTLSETPHQNDSNAPQLSSGDEDDHQNDDTNQLNSQNNTSIDNQGNSPTSTALPHTSGNDQIVHALSETPHQNDSNSPQPSSDDEDDHQNDDTNQLNSQNNTSIDNQGNSPTSTALPHTSDNDQIVHTLSETPHQNDNSNAPQSSLEDEEDPQNDHKSPLNSQNNTPIDNGGKSPISTALSHTSDNDQIVHTLSETPHQNDNSNAPQSSLEDEEDYQNDDTNQLNSQNNTPIDNGGNSSQKSNHSHNAPQIESNIVLSQQIGILSSPSSPSKQSHMDFVAISNSHTNESEINEEYHKISHSQVNSSSKDNIALSPLYNPNEAKQSFTDSISPFYINKNNELDNDEKYNQSSGHCSPPSSHEEMDTSSPTNNKSPNNLSPSYEMLQNIVSPTNTERSFQTVTIASPSPSQKEKNNTQTEDPIVPQIPVKKQVSEHNEDKDNADNDNTVESLNTKLHKNGDKANTSLT